MHICTLTCVSIHTHTSTNTHTHTHTHTHTCTHTHTHTHRLPRSTLPARHKFPLRSPHVRQELRSSLSPLVPHCLKWPQKCRFHSRHVGQYVEIGIFVFLNGKPWVLIDLHAFVFACVLAWRFSMHAFIRWHSVCWFVFYLCLDLSSEYWTVQEFFPK